VGFQEEENIIRSNNNISTASVVDSSECIPGWLSISTPMLRKSCLFLSTDPT